MGSKKIESSAVLSVCDPAFVRVCLASEPTLCRAGSVKVPKALYPSWHRKKILGTSLLEYHSPLDSLGLTSTWLLRPG
jgi:hypothetical protein